MPFNEFGPNPDMNTVRRERPNDVAVISQIELNKLDGRRRNEGAITRATPTSATDVIQGDAEGDIVNDGTYEYELKSITGVGLRWDRQTLNISW